MERLTKILIVIVIVLVAGMSLCVGLLLGNYFDKPAIIMNNTTNQSTAGNNSTNTTKTTENTDNPSTMSAQEAIDIGNRFFNPLGTYVGGITDADAYHYIIYLYNSTDGSYVGKMIVYKEDGSIGPAGVVT